MLLDLNFKLEGRERVMSVEYGLEVSMGWKQSQQEGHGHIWLIY